MLLEELRTLIARHAQHGWRTAIEGVLVSSVSRPTAPEASTTGLVMALIAQGAKRLALGDRVHEYRAGQYLVASVDLPITGHFSEASPSEPALGFGLILRPSTIASLLLEAGEGDGAGALGGRLTSDAAVGGEAIRRARRPVAPPGLTVSDASPELLDAVVRLLRLLDRPADLPILAPLAEREILWRLMTGEQGATVRQLGLTDSSLSHVSRAIGWIRDHHAESFRVEDLARQAGMSVSAFHRNFRAITAMSPIQFQKRIRLQEARLQLIANPDDVAGAGYAVGYDSASQFSREYRRQFGAPPGRDVSRLRAQAAPRALQLLP
ncbi:AraC family transcriptional regulator [Conexibacter sp. CPCC 206217]|uniref:AraC family transcriptional regulator n=1 Tax=Conexibacter sp. CPCC 206217 TaxID=3064574 RepID=UPI0027280F8D|nr:AraC family transcriptional regulator [Conexibacter sp. CPCC 206217]MDO8210556.1 AraC family transcriptional regulator [Conexibacter sp. CPCC 206217]